MLDKSLILGKGLIIDENEFAELLGVTRITAMRYRVRRQGPNFIKIGRKYYYRTAAIEDWFLKLETVDLWSPQDRGLKLETVNSWSPQDRGCNQKL